VIFPKLEPFGDGIRDFFLGYESDSQKAIALADSFAFYALYDTTFNGAANNFRNKFTIKGEITAAIASSYNLGFNVVEGSVEVIVGGNRATPNVDYTVDYITGQVTIRNQSFLIPGTDLQIRYEQNDLFQLASKSLLGARGQMSLGGKSALGFTVMNLNQQTLSDKVRLGEEPISNTILGFDAGASFESEFLTRALNFVPGIKTTAPSSFSVRGEAAYMVPDPNTRKSTIPQDEGRGIAYLDDFEGARRIIPLGSGFTQWAPASVPFYSSLLDAFVPGPDRRIPSSGLPPSLLLPDTGFVNSKMEYKAKLAWFNVIPSDVYVRDIWPNRSVATEQQQVTVLDLYFDPKIRGPFNYSMDLENKLFANPQRAWSGVMRPLGTTATNLLDENINFIELWIYFERTHSTAKLNIDIGIINEDVIPNRQLDTEDGIRSGIRNGTLNDDEDVGLDGLTDAEERVRFSQFVQKYPQYNGDPSGDNWGAVPFGSADPLDHLDFNGTENNAQAEANRFPDTEDLNRNNNLDRVNSYFEYELALDPSSPEFQQWVTGGNPASGWYQVRIPINEFTRQIGDPTFTIIESARLWITGAQDVVHLRLTEINLVGNQWEEEIKNDSTLRVSVVNIEDNPEYTSPPGVRRERDRTRPDQEIFGNEQSLNLIIHQLKDGDSRQAFKRYQSRPLDLFSYRTMKMFVHGDDRPGTRFRYIDTTDYDAQIFLRFGTDTLNFYEYRAPIRPGWDPQNEIIIRFEEITAIKLGRDSAAVTAEVPVPGGPEGAVYRVRGQPSLISVRFMAVGIENPAGRGTDELTGEVWLNELRLTEVDDTPGWAYGFETSLKLADIASMNFNLRQQDPFFHGLEQRFGSRNIDRTWTVSTAVGFEKFLPQSWTGTSLGFTYSHAEVMQQPRYLPGTDILVEEAAERTANLAQDAGTSPEDAQRAADQIREDSRSVSVSETYALPNIRINIPSSSWLITETINRLALSFSYNTTNRRNPTTEFFRDWGWNARLGYGLQFNNENYINPFFFLTKSFKLHYLPRNVSVNTTLNRRQTREKVRAQPEPRALVRNLNSSRSMTFNWQLTEGGLLNLGSDYSLDIQSNLVHLEVDRFGRQRSFGEILGLMIGGEKLLDFGLDQNYGQNISLTSRPAVPSIFKLDKIIFPSARYSVRYDWINNLQAGNLGRSAQWNSNLTVSAEVGIKTLAEQIWGSGQAPQRAPADTGKNIWRQLDQITRVLLKAPFFDFDRLTISFNQSNRSQNSGVIGRPGFQNLFGRTPFVQESLPEYGPSLLYQLGLASDPHGAVIIRTKDSFPFIGGYSVPGIRAPLGNLTDVFNQSNKITMRTSRPLWEGARLDLNWNVGWSHSVNRTITTDSLGIPTERSRVVAGDVERSFLSLPPTFIFSIFKTSVEEVNKRYERLKAERTDTRTNDAKLAQAFEEGMEAFPITRKIFGSLFPRLNWSIRWDGLEKFSLFSSFAQRVSFDHSYSSTYRRRLKYPPGGVEVTESQQILYSFSPLVGLNITFKELFKGNFGGTFRYGTSNSFDLIPANQKVTESATSDITLTANYNRRGFEIPFFGFSLSNDIDISFTYSYSKNAKIVYDLKENFKPEGVPQEGSSRTIMEPRIRYILSARVTASLYYKYTKVTPGEGGSRIPGSTINEGGLDIRVQIQ
jgi:cell surface protein SprA